MIYLFYGLLDKYKHCIISLSLHLRFSVVLSHLFSTLPTSSLLTSSLPPSSPTFSILIPSSLLLVSSIQAFSSYSSPLFPKIQDSDPLKY